MKRINRGQLKRLIQNGQMEVALEYDIEHDGSGANDRYGSSWRPAFYSDGPRYGDWEPGKIVIYKDDISSPCGTAYEDSEGIIHLIVHPNKAYQLRRKQ
jgi:hypothetical protein